MLSRPFEQLSTVPGRSAVREYAAVAALLVAAWLLQRLVPAGVAAVSDLLHGLLRPRLVGSVVYAALAITSLAAIYVADRRLRGSSRRLEGYDLFQLGGVAGVVLLLGAYWVHGAADLPAFPGTVIGSLATNAAVAGLAIGYARTRGFSLRTAIPDADVVTVAVATVFVSVLAGAGYVFVVLESVHAVGSEWGTIGSRGSAGELLRTAVLPGLFTGIGWGILYNGAIQERLRAYEGPTGAVALTTALIGFLTWFPLEARRLSVTDATPVSAAVAVLLSLLAAIATAAVATRLQRDLGVASSLVAAAVALLVVGLPLVLVTELGPSSGGLRYFVASLAVVGAVASVAYERSRSVWVPALAFASYAVLVNPDVSQYLAAFFR